MGSFISTPQTPQTPQQNQQNQQNIESFGSYNYRRQLDDYRRQLDDVIKENRVLKMHNEKLRKNQHNQHSMKSKKSKKSKKSRTSRASRTQTTDNTIKSSINSNSIKQYVEKMLENPDINIYGFPDVIEKQIYRNVFNMLLSVIDHTLQTSEITLFGHKIVFDVQPLYVSANNPNNPNNPNNANNEIEKQKEEDANDANVSE